MLLTLLSQLQSYGAAEWAVFVLITLALSWAGGVSGLIVGHAVIAGIVLVLDVRWVQAQMASPAYDPHTGPDFDGVFLIVFPLGVLFRVILINSVLLPLAAPGVWWRRRRGRAAARWPQTRLLRRPDAARRGFQVVDLHERDPGR